MTRRAFLGAGAAAAFAQVGSARPNLLIITNDQHRADCVGCYGNPVIRTPNLDRLASQGTRFSQHFVQAPQCVPSRASLHTGRYPHVHRTVSNSYQLPASEQTLAGVLNAHGYKTATVGELPFAPRHYVGGFQEVLATGKDSYDAFLASKGFKGAKRPEGPFQAAPVPWPAEMDETAFWAGKARDFLRANRSQPFFLHINFRRPHHPFDPPAPYDTMYAGASFPPSHKRAGEMDNKPPGHQRALAESVGFDLRTMTDADLNRVKSYYYGMISLNDHYIGTVLDELKSLALDSRTVVVFNADHGEMLGDHGLLFKGSYMYDEVLRVPLIIRAPGKVAAGREVASLVEEIDVMPTVLGLLGVDVPAGVQGTPLFGGKAKSAVFAEFPTIKMARTKDWKLVHYPGANYGELYDLRKDPHELNNLWADAAFAGARAHMEGVLADWLIRSQDPKLAPVKAEDA